MTKWAVLALLIILIGCMPDSDVGKVRTVNSQVNSSVEWTADRDDEWQTLQQTKARGKGDCEDFAIAKYTLLLAKGIPSEKLKIGIGYNKGVGHAVTLYYDEPDPLVLDNIIEGVKRLSQRPTLTILYTIDSVEELNWEIKNR